MTAMAAMMERAIAKATAMAMMLPPPPMVMILMTTMAAFKDGSLMTAIG